MSTRTLAIIGRPYQLLIEYAKSQKDLRIIGIQDVNQNFDYGPYVEKTYSLDLSSKENVEKSIKLLPEPIHGLSTEYESGILAKAWLGSALGLPSISIESALAATDKYLMRNKFQSFAPSITPSFEIVQNWDQVLKFAQQAGYPVVLKPTNLMKSLLVTISQNEDELRHNFEITQIGLTEAYQKNGITHRSPQMIIEEFLDGPAFSVDLAVDSRGDIFSTSVIDLVMGKDIGLNDSFNYSRIMPSKFSSEQQEEIIQAAKQGVQALGLMNSAAHAEIILTKSGAKIIEIGARFGGYRPRMYEASLGLNLHQVELDLAFAQEISLIPTKNHPCAVYEIFPEGEGTVASIENWEEAKQLPSVKTVKQSKNVGDMAGLSKNGYKCVAYFFLTHPDPDQFNKDRRFIEEQVRVRVHSA